MFTQLDCQHFYCTTILSYKRKRTEATRALPTWPCDSLQTPWMPLRCLQDRLFMFIFGGEDAVMQATEAHRVQAYRSRLTLTLWEVASRALCRKGKAVA